MKLKRGGWREGEELPPGTLVPAEIVGEWPLQNRMALERTSFVSFFQSPEEAEQAWEHEPEIGERVRLSPQRAQAVAEVARGEAARQAGRDRAAKMRAGKQRKAVERALAEAAAKGALPAVAPAAA